MSEHRRQISFDDLPEPVQVAVRVWIRENLRAVPYNNRYVTTYGLLDVLDAKTGLSLAAHQMNEALISMGFTPRKGDPARDLAQLSWNWNVGLSSPYFRKSFR